jgi:hypothetical protein
MKGSHPAAHPGLCGQAFKLLVNLGIFVLIFDLPSPFFDADRRACVLAAP